MDDDGDDKDDTKRRTRNLSEKKRRDQFNMLVSELSNLITNNSRKMDKSSILKSTITYLKNYNEITVRSRAHDVREDWKPAFLSNEEFTYLLLEALEAFVMVFSASGTIYYASDSILSLLGHKPEDVINTNIFDLTYEEDRPSLYNTLQKKASTTEPSGYNTSKENETMKFQIHIRRGPLNYDRAFSYDLVQFYGHSRAQHDKIDDERDLMDFEPRVLFVCIGRLHKPLLLRDVSLVDTSQNEFTSRHSLEWKFLFLDHRAPPIIGYLPFEVLGTSGYDYYHFDDLEKVVTCHEALMEKGELTSCHYRFLTKGQQWIWLQSRFYITYHQWNSKPEFVVCTHRVVSYDDVVETKEERVEQERTSETDANPNSMNETAPDDLMPMSPSYLAKPVDDSYENSDQSISQPASVKFVSASSTASTTDTVATTGASWPQVHNHYHDADGGVASETALLSEEARINHRARESHELPESSVAVQYSIGTHYIDPVLFGSGALVSPGMMSTMPAPANHDQAQVQEQLQRKHEELQQMIVRQQEELRRVKEQLLLARLGMLQPIVNVPSSYATPEEMQNQQRGTAELEFPNATQPMGEYTQQVPVASITLQPPQSHPTHPLPQHVTHPMHSPHLPPPPEQQQNMPQ